MKQHTPKLENIKSRHRQATTLNVNLDSKQFTNHDILTN